MAQADPWAGFNPQAPAPVAPAAATDPWAAFVQPAQPGAPPKWTPPPAPPGELIHGATEDYITGQPAFRAEHPEGTTADQAAIIAQALKMRAGSPGISAAMAALAPTVHGTTLGTGPILVSDLAALTGLITGRDPAHEYALSQEVQKQSLDTARREQPITSRVVDIAGAAVPAIASAPYSASAAVARGGGGLVSRLLATGADAGAMGGIEGAADAPPGQRLEGAAKGALTGAVVGPLLYPVAAGVGRAISAVTNTASDLIAQITALRGMGLSKPSADALMRAVESDPNAAQNIIRSGPGAMAADAGPATAGLLDAGVRRGGPGAPEAIRRVGQRATQAGEEITQQLDQSLGAPRGVQTAIDANRAANSPAIGAAYRQAYAVPIDYSTPAGFRLTDQLLPRVPESALNEANALMRVRGEQSPQIMFTVGPNGSIRYQRLPDVRQWDYIKRALDEPSAASTGQGALGGKTPLGRSLGDLAGEIADTLAGPLRNGTRTGGLVPEYGRALDTARGPIRVKNALEFGQTMLNPSVPRDVVATTMRGMAPDEREAVRQALRSQFDEKLANVKRTLANPNVDIQQAQAAIKELSSDAARQKIQLVIPQDAQQFFQRIDQAARAFELRAATAVGSQTFGRTEIAKGVKQASAPNPIEKLLAGQPMEGGKGATQWLTGFGPARQAAKEDRVWEEITRTLTGPQGQQALQTLAALQRANTIRGTGAQAGQLLGGLADRALLGVGTRSAVDNRRTLSSLITGQ